MHPTVIQDTPAAEPVLALNQTSDCATSDAALMARTDAIRADHFTEVRRLVVLACGEVPQP